GGVGVRGSGRRRRSALAAERRAGRRRCSRGPAGERGTQLVSKGRRQGGAGPAGPDGVVSGRAARARRLSPHHLPAILATRSAKPPPNTLTQTLDFTRPKPARSFSRFSARRELS